MAGRKNGVIRGSISAKLNIMIVLIILIVAGLLMVISHSAYREAVFTSAERRLDSVAIPEDDEILPMLDHFRQVFETEEFREAREQYGPGARDESGTLSMAARMGQAAGKRNGKHRSAGSPHKTRKARLDATSCKTADSQENRKPPAYSTR